MDVQLSNIFSGRSVLLWRVEKFTSPIADRMHRKFPRPPTEELKRASARGGDHSRSDAPGLRRPIDRTACGL